MLMPGCRELELFDGLGFFEGRLLQALVEAGRFPTLDLVLNDQGQELLIAKLAGAGLLQECGRGTPRVWQGDAHESMRNYKRAGITCRLDGDSEMHLK